MNAYLLLAVGKAALLSLIALVAALSYKNADIRNWEDFFPYGARGVFNGAAVIYFSYGGYNSACNFAEEVRHALHASAYPSVHM